MIAALFLYRRPLPGAGDGCIRYAPHAQIAWSISHAATRRPSTLTSAASSVIRVWAGAASRRTSVLLLGEVDDYAVIDLRSTIRTLCLASDFRAASFVEKQSALQSMQALQVPVSVPAEPASLSTLCVLCSCSVGAMCAFRTAADHMIMLGTIRPTIIATGPMTTIDSPQRMRSRVTRGRSDSPGVVATMVAPTVENGEISTIEVQTPMAQIIAQPTPRPKSTLLILDSALGVLGLVLYVLSGGSALVLDGSRGIGGSVLDRLDGLLRRFL